MCLGVDFFELILFGVCSASQIYNLFFPDNFGKLSVIIYLNIFFFYVILFISEHLWYKCWIFYYRFLVKSMGFSVYMLTSSVNSDSLTIPFLVWMPFFPMNHLYLMQFFKVNLKSVNLFLIFKTNLHFHVNFFLIYFLFVV